MNDVLKNITFEDLENPNNGITADMLFSSDIEESGKIEEKDVSVSVLKSFLEPQEPRGEVLRSLLDPSPLDLFFKEHGVGISFSAEIYEAGLEYIKKGWSIIPVGKNKIPLIDWKIYQEKRATEDEFLEWLKKFPDMQIGIVTGRVSNLCVVDIDSPDLDCSWLPDTATVRTGSGGMHYYYFFAEGLTNRARIKEYIDIRGEGGQVLAVPSENLKGKYVWVKKIALVPFPINLFIDKNQNNKISIPVKTEFLGVSLGSRNDEMTRYAGHLLAKIHPTEIETIAWPLLVEANKKNVPPLDEFELRNIFDSIANKEIRSNNPRWYKQKESLLIENYLKKTEDNLLVKRDYKLRYTWGTRLLDTKFSIIKRGNFIVLGAKSGSGKTTFAFDMAMKNSLLGHNVLFLSLEMDEKEVKDAVARKKAGITVEEEYDYNIPDNKQLIFEKKLQEISEIKNLFFVGVRRGGGLKWEKILDIIFEYKDLDLIFIDNLDLVEGEQGENDLDRQKRVVKKIMGFTSEKRVPVVLIHHYRKIMGKEGKVANVDDLSGSKKICDGADRVINITRNPKIDDEYPKKYKSIIYLQKGREYDDAIAEAWFIKGTFVDEKDVPTFEDYYGEPDPNDKRKIFGVDD